MIRRYLILATSSTPLLLVASFTPGLMLSARAGLMGLALGVILISWFCKYCFVVLDAAAAGDESLPVLSIEMVNPVSEQRPLALALMITCEALLVGALRRHGGAAAGLLGTVILVLSLPASVAVLGITGNPLRAISPLSLIEVIRGLRQDYLLLNVLWLAAAALIYAMLAFGWPLWSLVAGAQLLLLAMFSVLGGVLFEHRLELGIDTRTRTERLSERAAREHAEERQQMLDRAYAQYELGRPEAGWSELQGWISRTHAADPALIEIHALLDATTLWSDTRAADRLANTLIGLLLGRGANGEALTVLEQRLSAHPQFTVDPERSARLAELAGLAGKRALRRRLVPDA